MPIYLNQDTMDVLKKTFSYLTDLPLYLDKNIFLLQRRIALLEFNIINNDDIFNLFGLNITSFPVYHGGKYVSLGFSIGKYSEFVYISDVKIIPKDTMIYLKTLNIKTLVIDAINKKGMYALFLFYFCIFIMTYAFIYYLHMKSGIEPSFLASKADLYLDIFE
jgi:hypothetical protein